MSTEHGHATNWRKWLGHLANKPGIMGMEIGTWKGDSAEWMLSNIFTHSTSQYTCIDTFKGSAEHHVRGIDCSTLEAETRAKLAQFGPRCCIVRRPSHLALRRMHSPVDFIYVDGDHTAMGTLRDAVLGWDILKPGGIMIFDDYRWQDMPEEWERPKMAVDAFLACFAPERKGEYKNSRLVVLEPRGWQIAICKST